MKPNPMTLTHLDNIFAILWGYMNPRTKKKRGSRQ